VNRQAHALGSGLAMAIAAYNDASAPRERPKSDQERLGIAVVAGGVGAKCGSLPDLLEPALNPNHRQFFHSVAFGMLMVGGLRQLYRWQPDESWQRLVRGATLIAGGAYLVHLAMDATTKKSIPLIGRI